MGWWIEGGGGGGGAGNAGAGRQGLGAAGSGYGDETPSAPAAETPGQAVPATASDAATSIPDFKPETVIERDFVVTHPPRHVFDFFGDIPAVAACLPGVPVSASKPDRPEG